MIKNIDAKVREISEQLIGAHCWRRQVGRGRSLSLGFGGKIRSTSQLSDKTYGEWEAGTYRCAWRVTKDGAVICGSQDSVTSIEELNAAVDAIELGRFASLIQLTAIDVRIQFDSGFAVEFLSTLSDGDECFHVFCPKNVYVEFSSKGSWTVGKSNAPWSGQASEENEAGQTPSSGQEQEKSNETGTF